MDLLVYPKQEHFLGLGGVRLKQIGGLGTRKPRIKERLLGVFVRPSE